MYLLVVFKKQTENKNYNNSSLYENIFNIYNINMLKMYLILLEDSLPLYG